MPGDSNISWTEELVRRFWEKVDIIDGCWIWQASLKPHGYGEFGIGNQKKMLAHRFAYILFIGPIAEGEELDHLCRKRACVNPDHLEPVTHRVNIMRGRGACAENARKTDCIRGHPLTGDNLSRHAKSLGKRECRTCYNDVRRARRRKLPKDSKGGL